MTKLNYKREFNSLTIDELKAILTAYDPSVNQVPLKTKKTVKFAVQSLFITLKQPLENPLFYFTADDSDRSIICVKESEITVLEDFDHDRPRTWDFSDPSGLPTSVNDTFVAEEEENLSENASVHESDHGSVQGSHYSRQISNDYVPSENQNAMWEIIRNQSDRMDNLISYLDTKTKIPSIPMDKFKVTYTEELGVPAFIAQIEEWSKLYNLNDQAKIQKALASLVMSKEGLAIRECIDTSPNQTWSSFKLQLNNLLGKDKAHYRQSFRSMVKTEYESFGSFLSRLTLAYKYANGLEDADLTEKDKEIIVYQFIESLPYPIRGFLESEHYTGTILYSNVANRATQLQRSHQPHKAEQICALRSFRSSQSANSSNHSANNDNELKSFITEQSKMLSKQSALLEHMMTLLSKQTFAQSENSNRPSNQHSRSNTRSNSRRPPIPEEVIARMSTEECEKFKRGTCTWGEKCYRKHTSKN